MNRIAVVILTLVFSAAGQAQNNPMLLQSTGWGSLSGKVTRLPGGGKPLADAVVFLKAPKGTYFPIHDDDKTRKEIVIQIPPGRAFDFRMLTHFPQYFDGVKNVSTGQKIIIKGDSQQSHIIEFLTEKDTLAHIVGARDRIGGTLKPGPLPQKIQSKIYRELKAHIYVFDHPYYAITDKDGSFTIPRVPAGAEFTVMGWHEDHGWLLTRDGQKTIFKAGKNTFDIMAD